MVRVDGDGVGEVLRAGAGGDGWGWWWRVLTLTALTDAEYLISSVALSIDEYYAGVGESPGVWAGRWAEALGLSGVVEAEELRALVEGRAPGTGEPLLAGNRERSVRAFDMTFSAPKSVSLLWAFATEPVAEVVAAAHREAVAEALAFLEERAAVARVQAGGVRRRVATEGWAVAGFGHRTSREGDPQLHTHCLVPNLVRRKSDGRYVALDAGPLFDWCRAAGSVYQNQLQRSLSLRLGVAWGPDRHNTREMLGFSRAQLRAFSKRSAQVEAELEAKGARYESPALRMQADDEASLATRTAKDHSLTPTLLQGRWREEAAAVGLATGTELEEAVCWKEPATGGARAGTRWLPPWWARRRACAPGRPASPRPTWSSTSAPSPVAGSVWRRSSPWPSGSSPRSMVVRLTPDVEEGRRRPAQWSTAAHRAMEDRTLALMGALAGRQVPAVKGAVLEAALGGRAGARGGPGRGGQGAGRGGRRPQGGARPGRVREDDHAPCRRPGRSGRRPPGRGRGDHGQGGGRAGRCRPGRKDDRPAAARPGQRAARGGHRRRPGRGLPDPYPRRRSRPGRGRRLPGRVGMGAWATPASPSPSAPAGSPTTSSGWPTRALSLRPGSRSTAARSTRPTRRRWACSAEATPLGPNSCVPSTAGSTSWPRPGETRRAMADAVCTDIGRYGAEQVAALVVSHTDAEDLADRVRARLAATGALTGPAMVGPGWTAEREYRAGDRVLLHARCGPSGSPARQRRHRHGHRRRTATASPSGSTAAGKL